jgi:hypothetical protein
MGDDPMALLGLEGALKHYYYYIYRAEGCSSCPAALSTPENEFGFLLGCENFTEILEELWHLLYTPCSRCSPAVGVLMLAICYYRKFLQGHGKKDRGASEVVGSTEPDYRL